MTILRRLADLVGRLVRLVAPASSEPRRSLTEDDIASDRFFRRQHLRG